jgi:arsenate reductase
MKQKVLFLCTGNSCRSQMAEGFLRHFASDRFDVASAGTHPVGLNADAAEAMREIGIDISQHRSKQVQELMGRHFDTVITVCNRAKELCPIFPGASYYYHWPFDDPATAQGSLEERKAVFRRVRDEIAERIRHLIHERQLCELE